ncbi:MAG: ABC transporter permease [Actinopolymorphaceae bacterium]
MKAGFAGTWALIRLALRRDRVILPAWIVIFAGLAVGSAAASIELFPNEQSRASAAEAVNAAPALVALYGQVYDVTSLGAVAMIKMISLYALFLAVLAIFTVTRHTRSEEETGRLELVGAGVVGRYAALTAALVVSCGAVVVLGLVTALGLIGVGLPAAGSIAFGLEWIAVACVFATIAAVAAQVTENARTANGIAAAAVGVAFVLRAVGDTSGPGWLTWLSPSGWSTQVRPFAGDRFWVLVIPAVFMIVVVAVAYVLSARRDLGAGLIRQRPGPADAARWLGTPLGLAWRLQRGALLAWTLGFAVGGLIIGNIAASVGDMMEGNDQFRDLLATMGGASGLTDAFFAAVLGLLSVLASAYGVQAALRLRAEESGMRAEPVLASGIARSRWALSHLLIALVGTAWLIVVMGATAGLAHGVQTDDMSGAFGRVVEAALVQIPAIWVLVGIVAALFGLVPRLSSLAWVVLVGFLLLGEFGSLFELNQSVMDVSPYAHVPKLPGGEMSWPPLLWLVGIAAALTVVGLVGLRRRDVPVT